jgi:hypothetical protein
MGTINTCGAEEAAGNSSGTLGALQSTPEAIYYLYDPSPQAFFFLFSPASFVQTIII